MKLTPLDIRKQEFKRILRGLDPDEVEAFLGMVADEFEMLIREKNQLNDELIKLRTQLKDYQQVESTLRDTLVRAQNTVEESRANSRREAEIIIHEAELQAEHIIKEAKEELIEMRNDLHMLRMQKESFAKRLQHLLESQLELLRVMSMDDKGFQDLADDFADIQPAERSNRQSMHRERSVVHRTQPTQPAEPPDDSYGGERSEPRIIRDETLTRHVPDAEGEEDEDYARRDQDSDDSLSDQVII
ncbi:DivIVA domain-containing protein [candidate division KSB1 bacterium]|nr:DivIVA domain-containing protein [candidate division KSB1 bacterium]